jgi:cytochrome bd-type quinol oxidase subunit 2
MIVIILTILTIPTHLILPQLMIVKLNLTAPELTTTDATSPSLTIAYMIVIEIEP